MSHSCCIDLHHSIRSVHGLKGLFPLLLPMALLLQRVSKFICFTKMRRPRRLKLRLRKRPDIFSSLFFSFLQTYALFRVLYNAKDEACKGKRKCATCTRNMSYDLCSSVENRGTYPESSSCRAPTSDTWERHWKTTKH